MGNLRVIQGIFKRVFSLNLEDKKYSKLEKNNLRRKGKELVESVNLMR